MKSNIVRKIMEKKLLPYGFKYTGNKHSRWGFSRIVDNVVQEVVIQKSNWGNGYILEVNSLRIKTITGDSYQQEMWAYNSETEQQKVLNELGDLVIYYGLQKLKEVSTPRISFEPSDEMQKKLFADKESLTQKFLERYKYSSLDELEILQSVQQEMREIFEREYTEIQSKLIELAAVYGNLIIRCMGGEWKYDAMTNPTFVEKTLHGKCFPVLRNMVKWWHEKDSEVIGRNFVSELIRMYEEIEIQNAASVPTGYSSEVERIINRKPWAIELSMGRMGIHKTEIVREVLYERLCCEKGYEHSEHGDSWAFAKQNDEKKYYILVRDLRKEVLTFEFYVDGEYPVDGKEYIEKKKVLVDDRGCFPYKNEEEFRLIINEMGKVVLSQEDKIFKKIESNRIEEEVMLQMQKELFECHKELFEGESKLLKLENQSGIRSIEKVCKRLEDINKSMFFPEAKQELVALSAVYGELFCEVSNGKWLYNTDSKKCVVEGCGTGTYPLNDVIAAWRTGNYKLLCDRYLYASDFVGSEAVVD